MRNLRLLIAYDGTDFFGWQEQPDRPTVQSTIETALERLLGHRPKLTGSGRTDAGVHAAGQVANFHTENPIPCANLAHALNESLPLSIRIRAAAEASATFHARYCAQSKTYRYRIFQGRMCPPFLARFVLHYPRVLDAVQMDSAARLIAGTHDFTSFAAGGKECGETSEGCKIRTIFSSRVTERPQTRSLLYEVCGDGFLRYMVRNIVGTLIEVGGGNRRPEDIPRLIEARDRCQTGPTAAARGLCLIKVDY